MGLIQLPKDDNHWVVNEFSKFLKKHIDHFINIKSAWWLKDMIKLKA